MYNKYLITGVSGMLFNDLKHLISDKECLLLDRVINDTNTIDCDISDIRKTNKIVNEFKPDIILNLAAMTDLENCETNKDDCYGSNTIGAINLFNYCKDNNIPYVFISTAGIFGNDKEHYIEEDIPQPLSSYGKSKFFVEEILLNQSYEKFWIFRAGWMMGGGPNVDKKFVEKIMSQIKNGNKEIFVVDDKSGVPTFTKDFSNSIIHHINNKLPYGLYNMVSNGDASRYDVAKFIVEYLNLNVKVTKVMSDFFEKTYFATRPNSEKLINKKLNDINKNMMSDWVSSLKTYLDLYYK
jgi:dTDP-4-dehydrorhamnose reductase